MNFPSMYHSAPVFISAGKKGTTEHAAVWVPDSEASTCMHCMKSKFTALNRRVGVTYSCHLLLSFFLNLFKSSNIILGT